MPVPLDAVLQRGAVLLWTAYSALDDPALAGQTKAKFIVMLSGSSLDDPLYYILTTSEKAKHAAHPHQNDVLLIPAGSYGFFPVNTIVDAGGAGELEVDRRAFAALYAQGSVVDKGSLSQADVAALVERILLSPRVRRRFKHILRQDEI